MGKIEVFHDNLNNTKFAHVTFKENRIAYFALLDCKQHQESKNIVTIRPADAHLQPDNPVDPSTTPFFNLTDDCFLAIFDYCDFDTLAMLSTVCKKMCELLRTRVFGKIAIYKSDTSNEAGVKNGLLTVSRLVQCINPPNFRLKIRRSARADWAAITVDMTSFKSVVFVETDFFTSECASELEKMAKRIKTIHLHCSIYDYSVLEPDGGAVFPNVTRLILSASSNSCNISDLLSVVERMPKLEALSLRNGYIQWKRLCTCCEKAVNLQSIEFTTCLFDSEIQAEQSRKLTNAFKKAAKKNQVCLTFDQIPSLQSVNCCYDNERCVCQDSSAMLAQRQIKYDEMRVVLYLI